MPFQKEVSIFPSLSMSHDTRIAHLSFSIINMRKKECYTSEQVAAVAGPAAYDSSIL